MNLKDNFQDDIIENNKFLYIWIDILGFREDLEYYEAFDKLFDIRENFINTFSTKSLNFDEIISISDGLLLIWKLSNLMYDNIKNIFDTIGELQNNFILKYKKVIRGAIAVGNVSSNLYKSYNKGKEEREKYKDIFLISNGFLHAYKMESKDINWPIIATTDEELTKIRKTLNIDTNENFGLKKINGNNHIYLYMVDFLKPLEEKKDMRKDFEKFLSEKLKKYKEENINVYKKYLWLLLSYKNTYDDFIEESFFEEYFKGILL